MTTNAGDKPRHTHLMGTFPRSSKNADVLYEFVAFCEKHPEYRWYQCLAGFCGAQVLFWKKGEHEQGTFPPAGLEDRFWYEGKDK